MDNIFPVSINYFSDIISQTFSFSRKWNLLFTKDVFKSFARACNKETRSVDIFIVKLKMKWSSSQNLYKNIWKRENQKVSWNEKKYSELINSLNFFEEKDGISRSKGRITNSGLPYEARSPILLSKNPNFQNYCHWIKSEAKWRKTDLSWSTSFDQIIGQRKAKVL